MGQVYDLLELEVREPAEPTRGDDGMMVCRFEVRGIVPLPAPAEKGNDLALAVSSEVVKDGPRDPCQDFTTRGVAFRLVLDVRSSTR
jgi:hypothetical protein